MSFDHIKFENALVDEHNRVLDVFNEVYANRTLVGQEAIKALDAKVKMEVLSSVLNAVREASK